MSTKLKDLERLYFSDICICETNPDINFIHINGNDLNHIILKTSPLFSFGAIRSNNFSSVYLIALICYNNKQGPTIEELRFLNKLNVIKQMIIDHLSSAKIKSKLTNQNISRINAFNPLSSKLSNGVPVIRAYYEINQHDPFVFKGNNGLCVNDTIMPKECCYIKSKLHVVGLTISPSGFHLDLRVEQIVIEAYAPFANILFNRCIVEPKVIDDLKLSDILMVQKNEQKDYNQLPAVLLDQFFEIRNYFIYWPNNLAPTI